MSQKTNVFWAAAGVIVAILIAAGFFNSPNIVMIRQSNSDYTCPSSINSQFYVYFMNAGNKDTNLCVNVNSNDISFNKPSDCLFLLPNNVGTQFEFDINQESLNKRYQNLSITYEWTYNKYVLLSKTYSVTCHYNKTGYNYFTLDYQK